MQKKNQRTRYVEQYVPIEIEKSSEFNMDTCFQNMKDENLYDTNMDYYFDGYSQIGIHQEMLKDYIRTNTYKRAILENPELFKDKIVLDVGCGTGILSIFAAKAGAKHVYGIDFATIAFKAIEIVKENNLESKITIIRDKIEDVKLPVEHVDIIISEWMGYFLLFEGMLDTVLFARDKWLKKDGLIFPDKATMYIAAIEDREYREDFIDFWDSVFGVKMSCMKKWSLQDALTDSIDRRCIISNSSCFYEIDILTVKPKDLDFSTPINLKFHTNSFIHGFVTYFITTFSFGKEKFRLSTSPYAKTTHWKQTLFYLKNPYPVQAGEELKGTIVVKKDEKNKRELKVLISYKLDGAQARADEIQYFKICQSLKFSFICIQQKNEYCMCKQQRCQQNMLKLFRVQLIFDWY